MHISKFSYNFSKNSSHVRLGSNLVSQVFVQKVKIVLHVEKPGTTLYNIS